ncbi:hypothetical protein ES707_17117 [subsurface metagenome]
MKQPRVIQDVKRCFLCDQFTCPECGRTLPPNNLIITPIRPGIYAVVDWGDGAPEEEYPLLAIAVKTGNCSPNQDYGVEFLETLYMLAGLDHKDMSGPWLEETHIKTLKDRNNQDAKTK